MPDDLAAWMPLIAIIVPLLTSIVPLVTTWYVLRINVRANKESEESRQRHDFRQYKVQQIQKSIDWLSDPDFKAENFDQSTQFEFLKTQIESLILVIRCLRRVYHYIDAELYARTAAVDEEGVGILQRAQQMSGESKGSPTPKHSEQSLIALTTEVNSVRQRALALLCEQAERIVKRID